MDRGRARSKQKLRSSLLLVLAGLVVAGFGFGVGNWFAPFLNPRPAALETVRPLAPPVAGSAQFLVTFRDPLGGLPWAVRTYRGRDGRLCPQVGQRRGNRLGLERGRRFVEEPIENGGYCASTLPVNVTVDYADDNRTPANEGRVVVFGVARPGSRIRIVGVERPPRVAIEPNGGCLAVFTDEVKRSDVRVRIATPRDE